MTLEDQIQKSLARAAAGHEPPAPPTDQLIVNARRRQRAKLTTTGLGAAAALVLVIAVAALLPVGSTPTEGLVAGQLSDPTGGEDAPAAGMGDPAEVGSEAPTTSFGGFASTSALAPDSSIAPSGTGYAPPGSVVDPSSSTSYPMPTTTTAQPPPTGDTVTATQDDNGKTFTLRRGQHLVVSLSDGSWEWSDPDTDNPEVLQRTAVSANPSSTYVTASFDAKSEGQAHVTASMDPPCRRSNPPCMAPSMLWQITVNVI